MSQVNANWIERALRVKYCSAHQLFLPNVHLSGWWECDVLGVTKAGYMYEFEIKMSKSDFKADFNKGVDGHTAARRRGFKWTREVRTCDEAKRKWEEATRPLLKHDLMAGGDVSGPTCFFFCTPEGLLDPKDIPDHAGLLEFPFSEDARGWRWGHLNTIKKAPRLHGQKVTDRRINGIRDKIIYRYNDMYFNIVPDLIQDLKDARQRNTENENGNN